jgi:excisionase family DNA binding protein
MECEFLTIKEVAVIFSCHPNTIRRAVRLGYLIAIRVGNGSKSPYRISRRSLDAIHTSIISELSKKSQKT